MTKSLVTKDDVAKQILGLNLPGKHMNELLNMLYMSKITQLNVGEIHAFHASSSGLICELRVCNDHHMEIEGKVLNENACQVLMEPDAYIVLTVDAYPTFTPPNDHSCPVRERSLVFVHGMGEFYVVDKNGIRFYENFVAEAKLIYDVSSING